MKNIPHVIFSILNKEFLNQRQIKLNQKMSQTEDCTFLLEIVSRSFCFQAAKQYNAFTSKTILLEIDGTTRALYLKNKGLLSQADVILDEIPAKQMQTRCLGALEGKSQHGTNNVKQSTNIRT